MKAGFNSLFSPLAFTSLTIGAASGPTAYTSTSAPSPPEEFGGPPGPEPTRYGDWHIKGRVSDF